MHSLKIIVGVSKFILGIIKTFNDRDAKGQDHQLKNDSLGKIDPYKGEFIISVVQRILLYFFLCYLLVIELLEFSISFLSLEIV